MDKGGRYLLAAVQGIVGYEWLVSGANKVLNGGFPHGLADALSDGMKNNPNAWYVSLLRVLVVPNSIMFGYLIELCELAIGAALVAGAIVLCGRLPVRGTRLYRLALVEIGASAVAAALCVFLCVNFHFWMGDGIISAVNPAHPFDEGIDLDTLLAPIAAVVCIANARLLIYMIGDDRARSWFSTVLRHLGIGPADARTA